MPEATTMDAARPHRMYLHHDNTHRKFLPSSREKTAPMNEQEIYLVFTLALPLIRSHPDATPALLQLPPAGRAFPPPPLPHQGSAQFGRPSGRSADSDVAEPAQGLAPPIPAGSAPDFSTSPPLPAQPTHQAMKALLIFCGFVATISIISRTPPDVNRTIAPTPTPFPKLAPEPRPWYTPSRLQVSGELGGKKEDPKRSVK